VKRVLCGVLGLVAAMAWAEGARPWEGDVTLAAYSKTAMSITGDIQLSGPAEARKITFASGDSVVLEPVALVRAPWSVSGSDDLVGMVYIATSDPGELLNGNHLCGPEIPARYWVFTEEADFVQMAVFSGAMPRGIDAPGLCGTYYFTAG
jgi:hypothetical protein